MNTITQNAQAMGITRHVRDYTDRAGRPGRINDGYMFAGQWYKTLKAAKAAANTPPRTDLRV